MSTLVRFYSKTYTFDAFSSVIHPKTSENADAFFGTVCKSFFSTCPHTKRKVFETMRLQKTPLLIPFSKVFGYFGVGDRRKCIKKYVFSNENALVWLGHQQPIVMIISIIFIIPITIAVVIVIIIAIILSCHHQNSTLQD